jgi:hypothetical protein
MAGILPALGVYLMARFARPLRQRAPRAPRSRFLAPLLGEGDALSIVQSVPRNSSHSPLWDLHPTAWTDAAINAGTNTLQTRFNDITELAENAIVTSLDGGDWRALGIVINCPLISIE